LKIKGPEQYFVQGLFVFGLTFLFGIKKKIVKIIDRLFYLLNPKNNLRVLI